MHASDVAGHEAALDGVPDDVRALVAGVGENKTEIDEVISRYAEHWTMDRMPVVDRNILRIGVYEIMHTDARAGSVIDQLVTLAKMFSTEDSGRFVNGLLGRVAREHRNA